MGTTLTALEADDTIQLAWVIAIEGYENLISTWNDASAVTTAWAATGWAAALPGLMVTGNFAQRWEPFGNDLEVHRIQVTVARDHDDTFGKDVFRSKATYQARLSATFSPGDTTVNVTNTSAAASSGTFHIGTKAYSYSGKTSTTFTGVASTLAPADTDVLAAEALPGMHSIPSYTAIDSPTLARPPRVTDKQRQWVGRTVAMYLHRVVNGVLDVKAQAHLKFAGRIAEVTENGRGEVVLELEDYRQKIADTVIMQDQWTGLAAETGVYFTTGHTFSVFYTLVGGTTVKSAASLTCVASGASGDDEFNEGSYTISEFAEILHDWMNNDANLSSVVDWQVGIAQTSQGARFYIQAEHTSGTGFYGISIYSRSEAILTSFMGFAGINTWQLDTGGVGATEELSAGLIRLVADNAPFHRGGLIGKKKSSWDEGMMRIDITDSSGTFYDTTSFLPSQLNERVASGESWSLFSLDNEIVFFGRYNTTYIDKIQFVDMFPVPKDVVEKYSESTNLDTAARIRQVVLLSGTLTSVLTSLLASIDGNGNNHATYDQYPFGAAIPWSLLGDAWLASLSDIEQTNATDSIMCVVEKPTTLWDLVKADLMMRAAFVVWKNEGFRLHSFQTPNASNADYTLDETTKGLTPGSQSGTETKYTQEWLTNNVKLQYQRSLSTTDKYQAEILIRDPESIETYGLARPLTIKARNTYRSVQETGESVEALSEMIAARLVPPFGRPMRVWRVAINHKLFEAAPGDTVAFSDNFARNPTTGASGVVARGGTVLSVDTNYGVGSGPGQYNGSIEVLFTEEERIFPMSPAALSDNTFTSGGYTSGWDSTALRLATVENEYSESTEDADASLFADGEEVRIISIDPATPGGSDTFEDTVVGTSTSSPYYVELTNGFGNSGNPAYDAAKTYRIVSADYSNADSTQVADGAYIADEVDGLIEDLIEPNSFGDERHLVTTTADLTLEPSRHSSQSFAEGHPFHPGLAYDLATMSNNLINYRCRPVMSFMYQDSATTEVDADNGEIVYHSFPVFIGDFRPLGSRTLIASVGAFMRLVPGSGTGSILVISSEEPIYGDTYANPSDYISTRSNSVQLDVSSQTAWTATNNEDLTIVRSKMHPAVTFITIKHVDSSDRLRFKGLHRFYLKDFNG